MNDLISICITCKNRSRVVFNDDIVIELFPNLVDTLAKIVPHVNCEFELVVSDWMSTDWPLYEWLPEKLNNVMPYHIIKIKQKDFSRGMGRNIAFSYAKGDTIFFLDTDMLITDIGIFTHGRELIRNKEVFFPICYSYYDHQHIDGWWRTTGFGNLMVGREQLRKVGPWKEKFSWGGEDDDMFLRLARIAPIIRTKEHGFYHQWHPEKKIIKPKEKQGFWRKIFCK